MSVALIICNKKIRSHNQFVNHNSFLKVQFQRYSFICPYLDILRYIYWDWRWINRAIILIPSCQHQPSYIVFIRKGDDVLECVVQGSVIMLQYICFVESHGAAQKPSLYPFLFFWLSNFVVTVWFNSNACNYSIYLQYFRDVIDVFIVCLRFNVVAIELFIFISKRCTLTI